MASNEQQPRALVLGGTTGLLGQSLASVLTEAGYQVQTTRRDDIELTDSQDMDRLISRLDPHLIFNTLAFTQVELAEKEPEQAMGINRTLPCMLGRLVKDRPETFLVHYSTDFVFDGKKRTPYTTEDEPNPLNVYGASKLAGERTLLELDLPNVSVVRTAWLFGPGKNNFVRKILEKCRSLAAEGNDEGIRVVHDQVGSPTYTPDLAGYSLKLAESRSAGLFHIVNSGTATWCELASEAIRLAQLECPVHPVPSSEYPSEVQRPAYSVLDTSAFTEATGISPRSWPKALADYVYQEFLSSEE